MRKPSDGTAFGLEASTQGRVGAHFGAEHLEGDVAPEALVPGSVDLGHPSATKERPGPIPTT
jgi:hypothetical protein